MARWGSTDMSVTSTQSTSSTSTGVDPYGADAPEEAPGSDAVSRFQALTDDGAEQRSRSGQPAVNPLVAKHEQVTQAIADFDAGLIDAEALETELLEYVALLREQGFASVAYEQRGSLRFTMHTDSLPRSIRYMSYSGDDSSREQIRFGFQSLGADDQTMMARRIAASARASARAALNPFTSEQLNLAYEIVLPRDSTVSIEQLSQQAARVQALTGSTLDSPELQTQLNAETVELVRLMDEAGIPSSRYSIDASTGGLRASYNINNPPPRGTRLYNDYANALERNDYWRSSLNVSELNIYQQRQIAVNLVSTSVLHGARSSLDHVDVFGEFSTPPSAQMRAMQLDLDSTTPVDPSVDLDQMYQVNATSAQLAFQRQDLKQIEYRSNDAARAALGDDGFSLGRSELFELYRWIEGDGVEKTRYPNGDEGDPGMPPAERAFLTTWENTSREARIEYLGLDLDDWNKASPHIDVAMQANRTRRKNSFGLDDIIKIGIGIVLTKATAGALGPVFSGWFSAAGFSTATAGALGTTVATAVGTTLSTYVQTGKWSVAREVFKDLIEGELKDLLITVTLRRFGVSPDLANLATADNREELVKSLGNDLIREFSPAVIDVLKEFSPDVVDRFLDGLDKVIQNTDDPEVIAEFTASWWGSQLASLLGITDMSGIQLVSELLRGAVSDGKLDVDSLRSFLGREAQEHLGGLPDAIIERLGGEQNVLGVVAGMATQFVLDNEFDLDAAREDLKDFVENLAKNWVGEGGLSEIISWLPGSENWAADFHGLVTHAHANGWDSESIEAYLSESPLIANIVSSYVPEGVARDGLNLAFRYAMENDFDPDQLTQAIAQDLVNVVAGAGISADIVQLMGGDQSIMARAFAAGYIGDYASSMLATVLGGDAHAAIAALPGLIELGVATDWDSQQIDAYVSDYILSPLGETGGGILLAALGGKDNLVAELVSAASQAYIETGGSSTAAREAAVGVLLSAFTRLTNPSGTPPDTPSLTGSPEAPTLVGIAADFIEYADANDWDAEKLRDYVQNNVLSGPDSGPVLAILGSFGTNGLLAGRLVDELITVYENTGSNEEVVRHLIEFLLDPPALNPTDSTAIGGTTSVGDVSPSIMNLTAQQLADNEGIGFDEAFTQVQEAQPTGIDVDAVARGDQVLQTELPDGRSAQVDMVELSPELKAEYIALRIREQRLNDTIPEAVIQLPGSNSSYERYQHLVELDEVSRQRSQFEQDYFGVDPVSTSDALLLTASLAPIPGPGEALDLYTLLAEDSTTFDRILSATSLGVSGMTAGLSPNFGSWSRLSREMGESVADGLANGRGIDEYLLAAKRADDPDRVVALLVTGARKNGILNELLDSGQLDIHDLQYLRSKKKIDLTEATRAMDAAGIGRASFLPFSSIEELYRAANFPLPNISYTHGTKTWTTDALGRTNHFNGTITKDAIGRSKSHLQTQIGHEGQPGDVGFHLLADILGGPVNRLNVVPADGVLNNGAYKSMERRIANLAEEYGSIDLDINPYYSSGNTTGRPDKIDVVFTDPSTGLLEIYNFDNP